jgi:thymidine phosphorylase
MFFPQEIILKKRDSIPLTPTELSHFIGGVVDGAAAPLATPKILEIME